MRATVGGRRTRPIATGFVALVSVLLAWAAVGVAAEAATTSKTYTANVTPSMNAGGEYDGAGHNGKTYPTVQFTIKNTTSPQSLGSIDILPPPGITVTASLGSLLTLSGSGTATYQNDTATFPIAGRVTNKPMIALRNLNLAPGAPVTVSIPARMQCSNAAGTTWEAEVKQSNDFSGLPGNDFLLNALLSSMTTTTAGTCSLRWTPEPTNAQVSTVISGDPFVPAGGPHGPTKVTIYDGAGAIPVDWWTTAVTLTFGVKANADATLTGTSANADSSGTATFTPTIDKSGFGYSLKASTLLETGTAAEKTSNAFDIYDSVGDCTKNNCNANANTTATTAALQALGNTGFALLSINPGNLDNKICGTATGPSNGASDLVTFGANDNQQVTITLNKAFVNKSASKYNLCNRKPWSGTVWTVKNNTLPWFVYSDGTIVQAATPPSSPPTPAPLVYQDGFLPNCSSQTTLINVASACISYGPALVNKNVQVVAFFKAGDPPSRLR